MECKKHLLQKERLRKKANQFRFVQAQQDAEKIVQMIVEKYSPLRIYQWGSLLYPDQFQEISDIDIGVEGICDVVQFFSLLGEAMKRTKFSLDIVQMEKLVPEFAEIIKMKGRVVYER